MLGADVLLDEDVSLEDHVEEVQHNEVPGQGARLLDVRNDVGLPLSFRLPSVVDHPRLRGLDLVRKGSTDVEGVAERREGNNQLQYGRRWSPMRMKR